MLVIFMYTIYIILKKLLNLPYNDDMAVEIFGPHLLKRCMCVFTIYYDRREYMAAGNGLDDEWICFYLQDVAENMG